MTEQNHEISNTQRALWVFLGFTLVGPFFAALGVAIAMLVLPALGLGIFLPDDLPPVGGAAVQTYIWSALPAALTAVLVLPFVFKSGTFPWFSAAAAAVFSACLASLVLPFDGLRDTLPGIAFLAGMTGVGVHYALDASGILAQTPAESR